MKALPKTLYFVCFVGLAAVTALALNQAVQPSMSSLLLRAVIVAAVAGAPGLVYRKAWPAALVLLPLGAYLVMRSGMPLPASTEGIGDQYRFYVEQLRLGASTYIDKFFPINLSDAPELRLLMIVCVYWLIGVAAFLALSLRRAVPALVLAVFVLGFSLTVDTVHRTLLPALLFLILGACVLVFSRALRRDSWRLRDALTGGAVGVVASFLALALLGAAPGVVAKPWTNWRAWDPFRQAGSVYSFNWLQNYPSLLDPKNNVFIMSVESPSPSYWRANALETFTGSAWVTSQAFLTRVDPAQEGSSYLYTIPRAEPTPPGENVTQTFRVQSVYTNYFFVGGEPRSLIVGSNVALRLNDARSLHVRQALGPTLEYELLATIPELEPVDLVGLGRDYPRAVERYLALPFPRLAEIEGPDEETIWREFMNDGGESNRQWIGLYGLNQAITQDASDPYDIALRIERYLRTFFLYSLEPPSSDYPSPYSAFLFDTRMGYCQHFAGAMAILLRYNGIPARVAVGFTGGEQESPGLYSVTTNNAHAWVEVYFAGVGWVAFDPTPGRSIPTAGASSTSPGFINPFLGSGAADQGTAPPPIPRENIPEGGLQDLETSGAGGPGWLSRATWFPWVMGLVVALAAWPVGRTLWRRRRLRRGPPEQRLEASLRLLRTELSDHGMSAVRAQTLEEITRFLHEHLGIAPDPTLVDRAGAVLFGARPASPADVDRAEALRREVKIRLRKRHGWVRTALTLYGVPRRVAAEGTRV